MHIFITFTLSYFSFFIPTFAESENSSSTINSTQDILSKANVLLDLQKYDEALQYYDKVLAIDPKDIDTLYNKAIVLEDLERYDEALQYYDKVLAIDPTNADAMNNKMDILSINNTKVP